MSHTIRVKYDGSPMLYDYLFDRKLEVGEKVVVESPSGYKVVTVVETADVLGKSSKWIVDVVDTTAYKARLEKAKRAEEIRLDLERRAAQLAEQSKFDLLRGDYQASKLLDEYKQLIGADPTLTPPPPAYNPEDDEIPF